MVQSHAIKAKTQKEVRQGEYEERGLPCAECPHENGCFHVGGLHILCIPLSQKLGRNNPWIPASIARTCSIASETTPPIPI